MKVYLSMLAKFISNLASMEEKQKFKIILLQIFTFLRHNVIINKHPQHVMFVTSIILLVFV